MPASSCPSAGALQSCRRRSLLQPLSKYETLKPSQVDLPALLGVDLVHCERQAAAAVVAGGGALQAVQGELITQGYFDNLAAEIDELLQVRPGYLGL